MTEVALEDHSPIDEADPHLKRVAEMWDLTVF